MVFFHGVLSVFSLWLETILSLFPCCLPLRAVRLPFHWEMSKNLRKRHLASTLNVCSRDK